MFAKIVAFLCFLGLSLVHGGYLGYSRGIGYSGYNSIGYSGYSGIGYSAPVYRSYSAPISYAAPVYRSYAAPVYRSYAPISHGYRRYGYGW